MVRVCAEANPAKGLRKFGAANKDARVPGEVGGERKIDSPVLKVPLVIPDRFSEEIGSEGLHASLLWPPTIGGKVTEITNIGARHKAKVCVKLRTAIRIVEEVLEVTCLLVGANVERRPVER